jgi:hypothetical protein
MLYAWFGKVREPTGNRIFDLRRELGDTNSLSSRLIFGKRRARASATRYDQGENERRNATSVAMAAAELFSSI